MTLGVGGSTQEKELERLTDMTIKISPVAREEYKSRIQKAQALMEEKNLKALYIHAGTNLTYFTGLIWPPSERMVGAILPAQGEIEYISPVFEVGTLKQYMEIPGKINGWEEHESPYQLFDRVLKEKRISSGRIGLDESAPFFITDGISKVTTDYIYVNARQITATCRQIKSQKELALIQKAMDMTLEVQKATARILCPGIRTTEVEEFIHKAHKKVGAKAGSYFVIVLFGEASSYPHGVKDPQTLKEGDIVLIDTGCKLHNYISDITRTYVYGTPNPRQTEVWNVEKAAQLNAFEAAKPGVRAGDVDLAARAVLDQHGFGPDYKLPGLPHRTGHGIGLDIHEWPYLNSGDNTLLEPGMCFSNEPMICIPKEFGIRHEDHFHVTEKGAKWFTIPACSIEDPFGYGI